jgi:hypothetical protein
MATLEEIRQTDPDRYKELTGEGGVLAGREAIKRAVRSYTPTDTASYFDPEQGVMRPGTIEARERQFQAEETDRRMAEKRAEDERIYDQGQDKADLNRAWNKFNNTTWSTQSEKNAAWATYVNEVRAVTGEEYNIASARLNVPGSQGYYKLQEGLRAGTPTDPGPGGDPQGAPDPTVIRAIGEAVASGDMSKKQAKDALALLGFDESQQDATITAALGIDGLPSKEPDPGLLGRLKDTLSDFLPGKGILDPDDSWIPEWWGDDEDSLTGDPELDLSGIQIPQTQAQREEARFQTKQGPEEIYANYLNRALPEGASNLYRSFLEGRENQLVDLFGQRRALGLAGPVPTIGDVQGAPGGQTFAGYLRGLGPHQSIYGQRSDLFNRTAGLWNPELGREFSPSELEYRDTLERNPMTQYNLVSSREMMGVPKVLRAAAQRRIFQDYSKWRQAVSDAGTAGTQHQPEQFVTQYANLPNRWQ